MRAGREIALTMPKNPHPTVRYEIVAHIDRRTGARTAAMDPRQRTLHAPKKTKTREPVYKLVRAKDGGPPTPEEEQATIRCHRCNGAGKVADSRKTA